MSHLSNINLSIIIIIIGLQETLSQLLKTLLRNLKTSSLKSRIVLMKHLLSFIRICIDWGNKLSQKSIQFIPLNIAIAWEIKSIDLFSLYKQGF